MAHSQAPTRSWAPLGSGQHPRPRPGRPYARLPPAVQVPHGSRRPASVQRVPGTGWGADMGQGRGLQSPWCDSQGLPVREKGALLAGQEPRAEGRGS